jgi:hypothetical protein
LRGSSLLTAVALWKRPLYRSGKMKPRAKALILAAVLLGGCRATHDVAVTSYHVTRAVAVGSYHVTRAVALGSYRVATAPVKVLRRHSDDPPQTTTTTTSDVTTPGYPVPTTSQGPSRRQPQPPERVASSSTSETTTPSRSVATKPKAPPPPPRSAAAQAQFPTAKPVPGRAGLVYNPFDPNGGGYIDVSGYPPGTKVKDPDSQKIFIVP